MAVSTKGIRAGKAFVELFADSTLLVRGLKQAERRVRRFGRTLQGMGRRLLALSGAFAIPFVVSAKVFADFETQLAEVSTLLDNAGQFMGKFRREIRSMAAEFGQSTETLARGLFDIISAMIPAEEALGVLRVAAKLATAGLTETGIATDAITTILNAYGLSAKHAADVSDLFFQTAKRGKTTVADLAPNIGKIATLSATAGLSLEEFGAALASLTRVGLKTEDATTALKAILKSFLKPAKDSADRARELGFELNTTTIKAEGLVGVFERLKDLSPEDIAILFPNIRAIVGVFPLLRRLEGFKEDLRVLTDRAGATEVAFRKLAGTLSFAFRQIKESVTAVLSLVGEALADDIRRVTIEIKKVLKVVKKWLSENKGLIVSVAKIVILLGGLGAALLVVGTVMIGLTGISGLFSTALGLIVFPLVLVKGLILALVGSFFALLTPLGLVAALLTLAAVKFLNWKKIVASVTAFSKRKFEELRAVAEKTFQGVFDAFKAGDLTAVSKIIWLSVKLVWTKALTEIMTIVLDFWDRITLGAEQGLAGLPTIVQNVLGLMKNAWVEFTAFLTQDWRDFTKNVREIWGRTQNWLIKKWAELLGGRGVFGGGVVLEVVLERLGIKKVVDAVTLPSRLLLKGMRTLAGDLLLAPKQIKAVQDAADKDLSLLLGKERGKERGGETLDEETRRRKIEAHERTKPPLQTIFFSRTDENQYREAVAAWQKAADELGELPRQQIRRRKLEEPLRPLAMRSIVSEEGLRREMEDRILARRLKGEKAIAKARLDLEAALRQARFKRGLGIFDAPLTPALTAKKGEPRVARANQAARDREAAQAATVATRVAARRALRSRSQVVRAAARVTLKALDTARAVARVGLDAGNTVAAALATTGTGTQGQFVVANILGLRAISGREDKLQQLVEVTEKVEKNTRPLKGVSTLTFK